VMKGAVLFCILGGALGLQAPLEYQYVYEGIATAGNDISDAKLPVSGVRATVTVRTDDHNEATEIQLSDVEAVRGAAYLVASLGDMSPHVKNIPVSDFEKPVTFYFRRNDSDVVMEADAAEQPFSVNLKKAIANIFRMATTTSEPALEASPQDSDFIRRLDTYAGNCRVKYTRASVSVPEVASSSLKEDIQAADARKTSAGRVIQLEDSFLKLTASLNYSTCLDGAYVSSSDFLTERMNMNWYPHNGSSLLKESPVLSHVPTQGAMSRFYDANYVLKGNPQKFRVEAANVVSYSVESLKLHDTDEMVIVSNQTLRLISVSLRARGSPPKPLRRGAVKTYRTWESMVQSSSRKAANSSAWVNFNEAAGEIWGHSRNYQVGVNHPRLPVSINPFVSQSQVSTSGEAPKVSYYILIQAMSPGSQEFYKNQLAPTWDLLRDIMDVDVNPYGNGRNVPLVNRTRCQNGWDECQADQLMACARKHIPDRNKYVDYTICVMTSPYPPSSEEQCAKEFPDIDNAAIASCTGSKEADEALYEMGVIKRDIEPEPDYVPYIIIDGVHDKDLEYEARTNMTALTCERYTGETPENCKRLRTSGGFRRTPFALPEMERCASGSYKCG